ncbi:hypothetical protein JW948_09665 [bacterium]|nr:hypothetical protein [bacterium]
MKPVRDMSVGELAAFVCTHLEINGIHCMLTGGACVSIHTENRYRSFDLDFVENCSSGRKHIHAALAEIGYTEETRYFRHADTAIKESGRP